MTRQVAVFFGGMPISNDESVLKNKCPHIVVGTPGRLLALVRNKKLLLKNLKHFVLDECDKMLEELGKCRRGQSPLQPGDSLMASDGYDRLCRQTVGILVLL